MRKVKSKENNEDLTEELTTAAIDTAEHVQENVSNLPIISVAVAGFIGAGIAALFHAFKPKK